LPGDATEPEQLNHARGCEAPVAGGRLMAAAGAWGGRGRRSRGSGRGNEGVWARAAG